MKAVHFMNNGEFNVQAMLTFGVSAKEDDDSIGFFGTGFKYAVAIILRLGGSITVTSGEQVYEFTMHHEVIRGKEFDIVFCNGQNAGFTTHLGANWKPWQAFRELFSNCIDEGGRADFEIDGNFDTVVTVDCLEVYEAFRNRDDYFLIDASPIEVDGKVQILEGSKPFHYFKGVAVYAAQESVVHFNITRGVTLSEDRVAQYVGCDITIPASRAIQASDNEAMLKRVLYSQLEGDKERHFSSDSETSAVFIEVVEQGLLTNKTVNESARRVVSKLQTKRDGWPDDPLTAVQLAALNKAKQFLIDAGMQVDDYEIKVVKGLGDGVMGRAHEGAIYLSKIPFDMGVKQIASTLLEEWVHLKYDCKDFDRRMQSWLFDKVLSVCEELQGEPL